jgi:hypothetical protein
VGGLVREYLSILFFSHPGCFNMSAHLLILCLALGRRISKPHVTPPCR